MSRSAEPSRKRRVRDWLRGRVDKGTLSEEAQAVVGREDTQIGRAAVSDLTTWSRRDWSGGVELSSCAQLDRFAVRTRNSTYEITVLDTQTGAVMVRGGHYFADHTKALLSGCSLGGACLKLRAVYPGFLMEFVSNGEMIVTTRVESIVPLEASLQ